MLLLGIPLLIGIVVSEGRDVILKQLTDSPNIDVAGSRTAIRFSKTIVDALIGIFPYALSIGIFPYLAELAHSKNTQKLTETLISALRVCVWTFAPVSLVLIALRLPLLGAVWESGKFSSADTQVLSLPFVYYCAGMIGFACEMILNQTFYAMTNVWVPTILGLCTTLLNIGVAFAGVKFGYGLAAIAGGESLSKSVKCLILWLILRRHLGDVRARDNILFFIKVALGSLGAAVVAGYVAQHLMVPGAAMHGHKLRALVAVSLSGSLGMACFVLWSHLTRVEEVAVVGTMRNKLRARFGRRR
jgi:putative peptidoglycan lipid II flippase